jgi:hypothetical protein
MMEKFWMVWNEGSMISTVKHKTEESAKAEAERLARKHTGQNFHVLTSVGTCCKADVVWDWRE